MIPHASDAERAKRIAEIVEHNTRTHGVESTGIALAMFNLEQERDRLLDAARRYFEAIEKGKPLRLGHALGDLRRIVDEHPHKTEVRSTHQPQE